MKKTKRKFTSLPWSENESSLLTAERSTVRELSVKELEILEQFKENFGKDSDAGRDWGQEEKGKTEDEMAG